MALEKTVVHTLDLPEGTDWVWFSDANMVGLSRRLDEEGRQRALRELCAKWRSSFIRAA